MASTSTPIDLADILLDEANPRLDDTVPRLGQTEVIRDIMSDDILGQQIYKLALDIVQYGTDPTALLAVIESAEEAGKYITLEGNRRVVALKLLINPELVTGIGKKSLERRFKKLSEKFMKDPIKEVNCIIFDDPEEADHWIKMRHTGQNDGAGLVEWNSLSQTRYASRKGDTPPEVQVLDFVRDHGTLSNEAKDNLANFKITNLQRILTTKDVRDAIGLIQKRGILFTNLPEEEIIKPLRKIVEDLSGDIKVSQLMTKQQRLDYIDGLGAEFMPDHTKGYAHEIKLSEIRSSINSGAAENELSESVSNSGESIKLHNGEQSTSDASVMGPSTVESIPNITTSVNSEAVPRAANTSSSATSASPTDLANSATISGVSVKELQGLRDQKTIISPRYRRTIPQVRINELFKELKRLPIADYANAGAILLRVFIELSADEYIKRHNIILTKKESNLDGKIQKCLDHMIGSGSADHKEMQAVKNFTSDKGSLGSTVTLNAYVHNPMYIPEAMSLKITWHNMLPLIERIWP